MGVSANPDPVLEALDRAPFGEEDLSPEELVELARRADDLAAGRVVGIPHSDVQRRLEALSTR